jgi:phospholipid/cholesterol/gamma-HCH transport system substrate-binding protein
VNESPESTTNEEEEGGISTVGRVAAIAATLAAVALVGFILFAKGGGYTVTARFINAGQLVKGNPVQTGGVSIGKVKEVKLTPDGQAEVKLGIKNDFKPLREGTHATIRQFSLSGIANRYVDLRMPPNGARAIPDGGEITSDQTTTAVDLDQLFNTLDPKTRRDLQNFFKGNARLYRGYGDTANRGFRYLNPALSTSSRLFAELTRDTPLLERFLVDSSRLVSALAERRSDLSGLVSNLNRTTRALGNQKQALADSISLLPPFMRRANTTFVNLRSALDDVDPLVDAAKPVAVRLGPFLHSARAFAHDARPAVRDLQITIQRRGRDNDLIDLLRTVPPLYQIALVTRNRSVSPGGRAISVGRVRGALPEITDAFRGGRPEIQLGRYYTTDLLGWFDDFSTTGAGFDALGSMARADISFNEALAGGPVRRDQFKRCPGGAEAHAHDGSNVLSGALRSLLQCDDGDRAVGPPP